MCEYLHPVGGAVWEGLEGVVLLEEVCGQGWALRLPKLMAGAVLVDQDVR